MIGNCFNSFQLVNPPACCQSDKQRLSNVNLKYAGSVSKSVIGDQKLSRQFSVDQPSGLLSIGHAEGNI